MNFTEQETKYILQAVMQRPLIEALPLFLKMTNQRLAPASDTQPVPGHPPDLRDVKRAE